MLHTTERRLQLHSFTKKSQFVEISASIIIIIIITANLRSQEYNLPTSIYLFFATVILLVIRLWCDVGRLWVV